MIIDTIIKKYNLADKMIEYLWKKKKFLKFNAIKKLEEMTPLAKIVPMTQNQNQ